jgi:hypothetical protein
VTEALGMQHVELSVGELSTPFVINHLRQLTGGITSSVIAAAITLAGIEEPGAGAAERSAVVLSYGNR